MRQGMDLKIYERAYTKKYTRSLKNQVVLEWKYLIIN